MSDSKVKSTELFITLNQAVKDVTAIREWLYCVKDNLNELISKGINDFEESAKEAFLSYKNLSDDKLNELRAFYENVANPFTYAQEKEPTNPRLNDIWYKTDSLEIFKLVKNPKVTFLQVEQPQGGEIEDIWFKLDEENSNTGKFFICEELSEEVWVNSSLPSDLEATFNQEETPDNATLGDIWKKTSTGEFFVYTKLVKETIWTFKKDLDLKPYVWLNANETFVKEISQINVNFTNKTKEIEADFFSQNQKLEELKNEIFNNLIFKELPICRKNPNKNEHLANKNYVDYGGGILNLGTHSAINIDLSKAQHFSLNANRGCRIGVANFGGLGKSGTITIYNAQNLAGFNAPFYFRLAQSGFSGTEVFAYFCIASNIIRLVRT